LSLSRLFDPRQAQERLRGGASDQSAVRARDLPPRGGDHARGGWHPQARWRRHGGGGGGRDAALRRERDARPPRADPQDRGRAVPAALGRGGAALHARASAVEAEPWIAALADYIEQNDAAFRALPDLFPPAEVELLTTKSLAAHARIRPLLLERGHRGLIRRLHGDLHLGNIVLLDGRPVAFDAIEFSALIASADVLYDLAFLLMDLVGRGPASSPNVVFTRYLADTKRTEALDALAGLPLFLSMRAAIRAKVTAARIEHAVPDQTAAIARSARAYFDFARRFIEPSAPRLVAVGGLSGTGKSALAYALAPQLAPAPGAVVLRSDVERKTLFDKDEHDKLPEAAYSPAVTARVYATIADKARR